MNTPILEQLYSLEGRVALVTGAGAGLGKVIAQTLCQAGARMVIADIDRAAGQRTAAELVANSHQAVAITTDITDQSAVQNLFRETERIYGGIDILVNNAGMYPKIPFFEVDAAQWDQTHHTNLRGTFYCMQQALRLMRAAGKGGRIINISSVASIHPATFGNAHYSAAKAGVNALTRGAAMEFAAEAITVNAILPGPVASEQARKSLIGEAPRPVGPAANPARWISGRMGEPVEVASAVLFLAGPSAGYVTGQTLAVDGGFMVS